MPHLSLEYSANVQASSDFSDLFSQLHRVLQETGGIRIENCKSRAKLAEDFFIATGGQSEGFVHLDIYFMEGRSKQTKQDIGNQIRDILLQWFSDAVRDLNLQITVEIRDIKKDFYFKYPEGTLTPQ